MKTIKKEDLIENEIYVHKNGNIVKYKYLSDFGKVCGEYVGESKNIFNNNGGNFVIKKLQLATPQEKHWLNSCITADKFITFEEAMKTFIPEYVECINPGSWKQTIKNNNNNLIFDTKIESVNILGNDWKKIIKDTTMSFKPSTKEAYDAQFVVKEPEFVLPKNWHIVITNENTDIIQQWWDDKNYPERAFSINARYGIHNKEYYSANDNFKTTIEITLEQFKKYVLKEEIIEEVTEQPIIENKTELEIWLEKTKSLNLSLKDLKHYIGSSLTCNFTNVYVKLEGLGSKQKATILFNKWNKEIIEPLPQFKVIETIETITKVENNEGNQFFIGDTVKSLDSDQKGEIIKFRYSADKSNIIAITTFQSNNGIGIDKIEHYIEPKVEVKEETLLEKAKRLYPVGTKFIVACRPDFIATVKDHNDYEYQDIDIVNLNIVENLEDCTGASVYYKGKWAEIINNK